MFVYSGQCLSCPDLCSHHDYWIFKVRIHEWIHFFQWVLRITMILIWSSPLGETMSIVSRSYFLTQLILTFCDRVEKHCEVIKDDENLTRTEEKCQFPFKFKVCGQKLSIHWLKSFHLLREKNMIDASAQERRDVWGIAWVLFFQT